MQKDDFTAFDYIIGMVRLACLVFERVSLAELQLTSGIRFAGLDGTTQILRIS